MRGPGPDIGATQGTCLPSPHFKLSRVKTELRVCSLFFKNRYDELLWRFHSFTNAHRIFLLQTIETEVWFYWQMLKNIVIILPLVPDPMMQYWRVRCTHAYPNGYWHLHPKGKLAYASYYTNFCCFYNFNRSLMNMRATRFGNASVFLLVITVHQSIEMYLRFVSFCVFQKLTLFRFFYFSHTNLYRSDLFIISCYVPIKMRQSS